MKNIITLSSLMLFVVLLSSCSSIVRFNSNTIPGVYEKSAKRTSELNYQTLPDKIVGKASYYGQEFESRKTANGETYTASRLTAAHRELPFGTYLRVINRKNKKEVVVKVNDRGPFVSGRILDLSRSAAEQLDMINDGIAEVEIEIIGQE